MDDSDNSRTLPSVTRRRLMAGAAVLSVSWPFGVSSHEGTRNRLKQNDPALVLCQNWQQLHDKTLTLCREQQRLEAHLARTVGFPRARYFPENEVGWGRAHARLAALQARWDAADAEIDYLKTDDLIRQAEAAEQALLDDLSLSPASSIEGILAKLMVIVRNGEHWDDPHSFPWPHIRSVLDDIVRHHGIHPTT